MLVLFNGALVSTLMLLYEAMVLFDGSFMSTLCYAHCRDDDLKSRKQNRCYGTHRHLL